MNIPLIWTWCKRVLLALIILFHSSCIPSTQYKIPEKNSPSEMTVKIKEDKAQEKPKEGESQPSSRGQDDTRP